MTALINQTLSAFTESLADKSPVPGGGGASALTGALAASLGEMVASLTIGKKKYQETEPSMIKWRTEMDGLRIRLLDLVDQDAAAFRPLAEAYHMPKDTEEQRKKKAEVMELRLCDACTVPLEIMRTCESVLVLLGEFAEHGSKIAVSDAGCGAALAKAALESAALNVYINTASMNDRVYAENAENTAGRILKSGSAAADRIYQQVKDRITA
ncbi:MAG: cyclodeaminase/cyclohydrolase family protein [Eubacteriales bacterium]|nr:cyclodeaminase/cyclohydrolase family protein [Eubacteriales bacterium]